MWKMVDSIASYADTSDATRMQWALSILIYSYYITYEIIQERFNAKMILL